MKPSWQSFLLFFLSVRVGITAPSSAPMAVQQTSLGNGVNQFLNSLEPPKMDPSGSLSPQLQGAIGFQCLNFQGTLQMGLSQVGGVLSQRLSQTATTPANGLMGASGGGRYQTLGQMMTGIGGAPAGFICPDSLAITVDMNCPPASPVVPDFQAGLNSCEPPLTQAQLESMKMGLQAPYCAIQCNKAKILAVQQEASCLSAKMNAMMSALTGLMPKYQTALNEAQTKVQKLNLLSQYTDSQIKDVSTKLNGDPASGSLGLIKQREALQQFVGNLPQTVTSIEQARQQVQRDQQVLNQQIEMKKLALTASCFLTRENSLTSYRCTPNGPLVSPKDYLLCRFQQEQMIGTGGRRETSADNRGKASGQAGALASVLDQMFQKIPSPAGLPQSPQQVFALSQQPLGVGSLKDLSALYEKQLSGFGSLDGVSVSGFVKQVLQNCSESPTVQAQVDAEVKSPNTALGGAQVLLKKNSQTIDTQAQNTFNQAGDLYSRTLGQLTGSATVLDVQSCRTGAISNQAEQNNQIGCLRQVQTKLQSLLTGAQQPPTQITLQGNAPAGDPSFLQLSCTGLNQCIQALQSTSRELQVQKSNLGVAEKQYVLAANQTMQNFTTNVTQGLGTQSAALQQQLSKLMGALGSLGVTGPMGSSALNQTGQTFRFNSATGLMEMPSVGLLAAMVNPPIQDPNATGMASAVSQLSSKSAQWDANLSQITQALSLIQGYTQRCRYSAGSSGSFQDALSSMDLLNNAQCSLEDCKQAGHASLMNEIASLQSVVNKNAGLNPRLRTDANAIEDTVRQVCAQRQVGQQPSLILGGQACTPGLFSSIKRRVRAATEDLRMQGAAGVGN